MDQRQGTFTAKINISFVNDHHSIGVALDDGLNVPKTQAKTCGGVGIGDEHGAFRTAVVLNINGKILLQGDLTIRNVICIKIKYKDCIMAI